MEKTLLLPTQHGLIFDLQIQRLITQSGGTRGMPRSVWDQCMSIFMCFGIQSASLDRDMGGFSFEGMDQRDVLLVPLEVENEDDWWRFGAVLMVLWLTVRNKYTKLSYGN